MTGRSRTVLSPIPSNGSPDGAPFGQEHIRHPHVAARPRQRSYLTAGRRKMRAADEAQLPLVMGRKPKVATVDPAASSSSSFAFHEIPARAVTAMRNFGAKATAGVKRKRGGGVALQPSTRKPSDTREPSRRTTAPSSRRASSAAASSTASGKAKLVSNISTASSVASSSRAQGSAAGSSPRSLRRGMGDMMLSDRADSPEQMSEAEAKACRGRVLRAPSQRKASGSGSRPINVGRRSSRTSKASPDGDEQDDGGETDDDDDERHGDDFYLHTAVNWQLLRLKKSDLMRLHHRIGTFQSGDEAEIELFTKQELADEIVKARSRPDNRRPRTPEKPSRRARARSSPRHSWSTMDSERDSPTLSEQNQRSDGDDEEDALHTDVNDGGGEETEAEAGRARRRRRNRAKAAVAPAADDSATSTSEEEGEGGNDIDPDKTPRERPRAKSGPMPALPGLHIPRLRGGSTTSSLRTGGATSPFGKPRGTVAKLRKSGSIGNFVASSPARTRLRTRRHAMGSNLALAPSPAKAPALRTRPAKAVAFSASQHEADDEAEQDGGPEDWVDDSPPRRRPTREAKRKAEAKLHAHDDLTSPWQPSGETFDDQSFEMGDMSVDGSPLATRRVKGATAAMFAQGIARRTRSRTASSVHSADVSESALESSSELSDETAEANGPTEDDDDDDAEDMSETEMMASPSKVRRLRNGKLRMPSQTEVPRMLPVEEPSEVDESEMSLDEQCVDDSASEEEEEGEEEEEAGSLPTGSPAPDAMANPTSATLGRLRRAVLLDHCQARNIDIPKTSVKAEIISALLAWHSAQQTADPPTSYVTAKPDSASSMETAKAGSDQEVEAQAVSSTHISNRDAINTPLLLRAKPATFKSPRPPSPKLNSKTADAQPAVEGTDELNGLDLESLNLVDKEIHPSKLQKLNKIGSGGFKDVYVGTLRISKTRATKVAISDIRDHLTEMDIKELSLLRDLEHANIVRFIGVSIPEQPRHCPCMIVTELCTNGDLFDYIRTIGAPPDDKVFSIMLDIAKGIEYLHSRDPAIIHRDIKSTNVFITGSGQAKLGDFGLARVKQTMRSKMRSLVGTVNWQAPELWHPKPIYNEKIDVWSAAMTFWELTQWDEEVKRYPFEEMTNEHMVYLEVGQKKVRPPLPDRFHQVHSLLDVMWHHDPRKRPSMASVVQSMTEIVDAAQRSAGRSKR